MRFSIVEIFEFRLKFKFEVFIFNLKLFEVNFAILKLFELVFPYLMVSLAFRACCELILSSLTFFGLILVLAP